jgi:hypothetical protein
MTSASWLMLAGGVLLVAWGVRQRLGRTSGARNWAGEEGHDRAILVLRPACGVALIIAALAPLSDGSRGLQVAMGLAFILVVAIALGWGMFRFPMPAWSLPSWYRTQTAYRKDARRKAKEEKRRAKRGETTSDGS